MTEGYDLKEGPIIKLDPVGRHGYVLDETTGKPYFFYFTHRRMAVIFRGHVDFGNKTTKQGFHLRAAIRCVFTLTKNVRGETVVHRIAPADDWHNLEISISSNTSLA
ncbi:MAG: hypothetical protein CO136_02025 [Candidatus Levybacteria bacterium CG_4_9_14_3_um_filter_36_7]|nr:MAG: hypothetical protein CO136_02025 [Candidatus Levybacteria bacterium CG_4_9_14_3_um_filter_36_7]